MQSKLNLQVKFRESFRPFAPAVLVEDAGDWFQLGVDSPYMMLVADIADSAKIPATGTQREVVGLDMLSITRSSIPAVTHVDYSARIQTVDRALNVRFHTLLTKFKKSTGCPVLINTSFNVRGEPIVCTPEDAFRCFMGTDLDSMVVGNCYLDKAGQNPALRPLVRNFAPD